ncbi:hypothetical protein RB595_004438 [Gaeumannomyces hyphopodioides]
MSSPYDNRGSSRRHGVWSHWVPLALTVTVATVGVAAWVWSQRSDDDDESALALQQQQQQPPPPQNPQHTDIDYNNADYGDNPPYGATNRGVAGRQAGVPRPSGGLPPDVKPGEENLNAGWGARMSGALRRTPSPQQFFDSAGKTVAAGVAAAGAAVGSALAAIREEDKGAYADHETWSEEADAKKKVTPSSRAAGSGAGSSSSKRRKTVAIVVSADTHLDDMDADGFVEHASILSHIPKNINYSKIKLFVLIYAPSLKDVAVEASTGELPPASLSSSFSNIDHAQAQSPKDEKNPILNASSSNSPGFNAIYSQALALVEKETMVLPYTSSTGHSHILRHLQPDVVYLQESLSGDNGSVVTQLQTWLSKDIILVVGAESGDGGLADSESETDRPSEEVKKWWQREERVGRGRGVIVVDGMRVGDDWGRRVQGRE